MELVAQLQHLNAASYAGTPEMLARWRRYDPVEETVSFQALGQFGLAATLDMATKAEAIALVLIGSLIAGLSILAMRSPTYLKRIAGNTVRYALRAAAARGPDTIVPWLRLVFGIAAVGGLFLAVLEVLAIARAM